MLLTATATTSSITTTAAAATTTSCSHGSKSNTCHAARQQHTQHRLSLSYHRLLTKYDCKIHCNRYRLFVQISLQPLSVKSL